MMMISSNSMEDYSVSSSSSNIDQNDDPTDDLDDDYHHHLNHQNLQPNDNLILMMKNYTNKQLNHFCNELLSSLVSSTTTAASNKTSEVEIEFCKSYISSSTAESSSDTASSFQFTSEPYYFSQMPNLTKTIINNLLIESKFYVPNNLSSSSSSPLSFEQIQNNPFDDYNHSMMMINNNDYNGNITDLNNNNDGYLNPNLKITLIVLLSLMIVFTVIGNILVCLSVILVRKLRHPSNYLLVSLAISDLCVAILVMPLALQYELSQSWRLSQNICDLWVSFDVTACTSSILNLCTISIDRYLAIKKPLTYGVRRTTRRILSFIVTVWIASCLISIPPVLILGNEHGTPEQPICEVSQNRGYQLYATLGSFYIPLFVMIVMYYKIYVAAKRVVDAELRDQRPSSCTNQTSSLTLKSSMGKTRKTLSFKSSNRFYSIRKQSPSSTTTTAKQQQQLQQQQQINYFDPSMKKPSTTTTTTVQLLDKNQNYLLKQNDKTNHIRMKKKRKKRGQKFFRKYCCCCCGYNSCCCGCHCCQNSDYFDCGDDDDELSRQQNSNEIPVTTSTIITPAAIMVNSDGKTTTTTSTTMLTVLTTPISTTTTSNDNHKHLNGHQKLGKKTLKQSPSPTTTTTTTTNFQSGFRRNRRRSFNNNTNTGSMLNNDGGTVLISGSGCSTTLAMKQRASNALRERKASVTLGIIMTAFTVCWLPFFILAVLRPFSASVMQIPRYVTSIALWLGYVNSMLNPIIYVTFHQDFRRAFKYLLCFQCRSMGTRLREEAYLSQYGKCNLNQQQQFRQQRNLNFENFEQQQQQQQRLQQQQQRSCKIIVHDDDDDMVESLLLPPLPPPTTTTNDYNNNNQDNFGSSPSSTMVIDNLELSLVHAPPSSSMSPQSSSKSILQTEFPSKIIDLDLLNATTTTTMSTTTTNARINQNDENIGQNDGQV